MLTVTLTKNIGLTWIEYLVYFGRGQPIELKLDFFILKISKIDLLALTLRRGSTFQWSLIEGGNLVNLCYLKLGNIILINHTTNQVLSRLKKLVRRTNNSSEYQYYIAFYIIILRAESQHQYRNLFESYILTIHLLRE